MPKSRFTIAFLSSFLAVLALLAGWQVPAYPQEIWIILGLSLLLFFGLGLALRSQISFLMLCIVLGASLAFMRVASTTHVTTEKSVEFYAVQREEGVKEKDLPRVTLHGVITDEPDRRPMQTKYTIEVDEVCHPERSRRMIHAVSWFDSAHHDTADCVEISGHALLTDHAFYPLHHYGDEVLVTGILERPTQIENFAYDRYLSRYGIYSVMYRATVETVSSGHGSHFFSFLYTLKDRFEQKLNRLYPEPHASLMAGLLTGSRRGIPDSLLKNFQATGLTHIIAISGYNIAIVIAVISGFLFFLPLKFRLIPSLLAVFCFTLFVGASPSVTRAAIMGALALFALHVGREKHALIAILLTAAIMTAWNPKILWYDAGFQLSFLSVLGLSFLAPFLERFTAFVPQTLGLRESFQMTIAAQIAAVPLVILLFGQFSLVAPVANILVAPFIPLAMLFGFLGTLVGFLSEPLGLLIAYPGWGALELIIRITQFFAELPFASVAVGALDRWYVWGYYALLFVIVSLSSFHLRRRNIRVSE